MAEQKSNRGGKRPGAGRKPKLDKFATPIAIAETRCADKLPWRLKVLETLADGEAQQTEEKWQAAGTITKDETETAYDANGNPRSIRVKVLVFPDLPPEQLVLVGRTVTTLAPDKTVNMYLADRVMGKPTSTDEMTIRDKIEAEINDLLQTLEKSVSAQSWREVKQQLDRSAVS